MVLRALAVLGVLLCVSFSGCCSGDLYVSPPPPVKLCYGTRLAQECLWYYADMNDLVFGINYYNHMESKFQTEVYR